MPHSLGGRTAAVNAWARPAWLTKVPSFSAKLAAGMTYRGRAVIGERQSPARSPAALAEMRLFVP